MTVREAAADFWQTHRGEPWVTDVGALATHKPGEPCVIGVHGQVESPSEVKARLSTWRGFPVVFVSRSRGKAGQP